MVRVIQPGDLNSGDFDNNNSNNAGGVTIRPEHKVPPGGTAGQVLASDGAGGRVWQTPALGADGVISGLSLAGTTLTAIRTVGAPITVNLAGLQDGGPDGVVNGGSFNTGTNVLTLTRSIGAPLTFDLSSLAGGGGGGANLTYTASPTNGTVNSDTGTDAIIPLVSTVNAGLAPPRDGNVTSVLRGDGTWGAPPVQAGTTNLTYTAAPGQGTVNSDTGNDAVIPLASTVNAGLAPPRSGDVNDYLAGDGTYQPLPTAGPPVLKQKGADIVFTASGIYTPSGADVVVVDVEIVGGGGGSPDQSGAGASSGGNGGGYAQKRIWGNLGPATVTIGAGGAVGAGAAAQGGHTRFAMVSAGVNMRGYGGFGGYGLPGSGSLPKMRNPYPSGITSLATGGDVNISGGFGGPGFAASQAASGGHGGNSALGMGGHGESWGGTSPNGSDGGSPTAGTYGGGASGAVVIVSGTKLGAAGAQGVVIIREYTA